MSLLLLFSIDAPAAGATHEIVATGAAGFSVTSSPDDVTYTAVDGLRTFEVHLQHDVLPWDSFKDQTKAHLKLLSHPMTAVTLSGNVVFASGTKALDTGIKNLLAPVRTGGPAYVQRTAGGVTRSLIGLASSFTLAAAVDGSVTYAVKLDGNGFGWT